MTLSSSPSDVIVGGSNAEFPQVQPIEPPEVAGGSYSVSTVLPDGNFVAIDQNSGALFLYDGKTDGLISTLLGVDNGAYITTLSNGNFVVCCPDTASVAGSVTLVNGVTGLDGTVSSANSLIGISQGGSWQSNNEVTALPDGNYVVDNPYWHDGTGFAAWGNGMTGLSGLVSSSNSLLGSQPGDYIGIGGTGNSTIMVLANGNYLIASPQWNDSEGAVTWANEATGIVGTISANNSLIGAAQNEETGDNDVILLPNGTMWSRPLPGTIGGVRTPGVMERPGSTEQSRSRTALSASIRATVTQQEFSILL